MTKKIEPQTPLSKWLDGYKTYIAAAGILVCGILEYYQIKVPIYVLGALSALGLYGLRKAISGK